MSTVRIPSAARQPRPAAPRPPARPSWQWVVRPVATSMGWKGGVLTIGATAYIVTCQFEQNDEYGSFAVIDLHKNRHTTYRLILDPQGNPSCDCPDAVYCDRAHCCKHAIALREACESLERLEHEAWLASVEASATAMDGYDPFAN